MNDVTKLESWTVLGVPGTYRLHGQVFNHPRADLQDTDLVTTSRIVSFNPLTRIATTRSGTQYQLQEPNPKHLEIYHDPVARLTQLQFT